MNDNQSHRMCFLSVNRLCQFHEKLPSDEFANRSVFLAYDSQNPMLKLIKQILRDLLKKHDLELVTFEDQPPPASYYFCENICRQIRMSAFVIADIGKHDSQADRYNANPNVTLEIGLAWGLGKKVIIFTPSQQGHGGFPSDFMGMQVYTFPNDFTEDSNKITKAIDEIVRNIHAFDPITLVTSNDGYREMGLFLNQLDGNRFGVHRRLPTIALSEDDERKRLEMRYGEDSEQFKKHFEYWTERQRLWNKNRHSRFKEWAIFDKQTIEEQIKVGRGFGIELDQNGIAKLVENFLEYLRRENFEVAISDQPFQFTFHLVEKKVAWLYSISNTNVDSQLSGVLFTTSGTVDSFKTIFDELYERTRTQSPELCDKDSIAEWLDNLIA